MADAAVIPTALGVNPSLTISALSLRIAANIVEEIPAKSCQEREHLSYRKAEPKEPGDVESLAQTGPVCHRQSFQAGGGRRRPND